MLAAKSAGKPLRHNMAVTPKPLPPPPPPEPIGRILSERHIPPVAAPEGSCAPDGRCLTFSFMASMPTRSIGMSINSRRATPLLPLRLSSGVNRPNGPSKKFTTCECEEIRRKRSQVRIRSIPPQILISSPRKRSCIAHLIPERNDIVGGHDHRPDARQAYTPPGVRIADVDEVLRWRREHRLETMTACAPSYRADLRLLGGGGVSVTADVVDRVVGMYIPRNTEEGRGLRVMGTHPLRVEVGMLDVFHY